MTPLLILLAYLLIGISTVVIYFKFISDFSYDAEDEEDFIAAMCIMALWPIFWILGA